MKNRTYFKLFAGLLVSMAVIFCFQPGHVFSAEFTADIVITGPVDNYTFKLYVRDNMYRLQKIKGPMNMPPYPTIVNRDTAVTWGLNPQMRQYVEIKDIEKTIMMNPLIGWTVTRKGLAEKPGPTETMNGHECETWVYTEAGKSEIAAKVWFSKKLRHIIRDERFWLNKNPVLELRDIQEGPVDPTLFEIPEGYTKMDMGGDPGSKSSGTASKKVATASAGAMKPRVETIEIKKESGNLMFILDASGSMWGQVEGKAKIAIAKEVLTGLIKELPDDAVVGLVAYGHRRKGDCNDVEELVPLGKIDKDKLTRTIQGLNPKGKTPISRSVRMTAERIKHLEDETTIILVSDGKETCDPDPCGLVKELKEAGIRFVMHVIGFDVTKEEKAQLECMAQSGGGEYFTAKNAKDFQMAAKEVVKKASEKPPVSLQVTCIKDGKPFKAHVQILTQGGEKQVAQGWTSADEPAAFRLPPAMYDIRAQDQGVIERPTVDIKDVEIIEGQTTERIANFATEGILHVKAIKNNAPISAQVYVYRQEDKKSKKTMGGTWTKKDGKPAEYKLLPGIYKIWIQDPSVKQRPVIWIEDVEVKAGETVERVATFGQGGILHVKAIKNNAPAKIYFKVYSQEDEKYMGDGWTREDGKPDEYKLLPGIYKVYLQDRSVKQRPEIWIENVEIKADQTVERFATFVEGGVLKVTASKNGAPYKAYVKIYQQQDNKYMGDGWAREDGKATEYNLLPGAYTAKVEDRKDRSVREIRDIQVQPGKTLTVNAAFPLEEEPSAQAQKQTPAPTPAPESQPEAAPAPKASGGGGTPPGSDEQTSGSDTIMNGQVPLYPGARVLKEQQQGGSFKVDAETTATPQKVIDFYKTQMPARDWQLDMAMVRGVKGALMATHGGAKLVVSAETKAGKCAISLTLINQ